MSDLSFLSKFITEEVYLIKEELPEKEKEVVAAPVETIATETVPVQAVEESEPIYLKPLPTEGNNLKHCLIFFESDSEQMDLDQKTFLLKILASVKRGIDDVLLVNVKDASKEQIEAILNEHNHRQLLSFGSPYPEILANAQLYTLVENQKKTYLKCDDLFAIEKAVDLKKALWAGLKQMFL